MNKTIVLIFTFYFVFTIAFLAENIIKNGNFEGKNPIASWSEKTEKNSGKKDPEIVADTSIKKEGAQSLKITTHGKKDLTILVASPVPVSKGKTYRISCWIKNNGSSFELRQDMIKANGQHIQERYKRNIATSGTFDWKYFETKVAVRENEKKMGFTVFAGGTPGTIWLDDFKIEEVITQPGSEVAFRMTPNCYTDNNVYALPQDDPMIVYLTASNEAQHVSKNPRIVLELPEGIELVGCDFDSSEHARPEKVDIDGRSYTRYDYKMGVPGIILGNVDFSSTAFGSVVIILKATKPAGDETLKAFIHFKDDKITCVRCPFDLKIIPSIPKTLAPKNFETGISSGTSLEFFGAPLKEWISFYKKCGFNEITIADFLRTGSLNHKKHMRDPEPIVQAMKDDGLIVYNNSSMLTNGYMVRYIPMSKDIPESVFIKRANGTIAKNAFDPAYIYRNGEWYLKAVNYILDQSIQRGYDHLWSNWEPHMYRLQNGSFTKLSLEDFAKFTGIPNEEIAAMDPQEIPKKYPDKLMQFQSWQFEKSMQVLNDIVNKKTKESGKKINLLICVGPNFLDDFVKGKQYWDYTGCFQTKDFLKHFDRISSWHYLYYESKQMLDKKGRKLIESGYRQGEMGTLENRTHREGLDKVEKMIDFIGRTCRNDNRKPIPYIHLSQNLQCNEWVVTPEEIGLQMLTAFIGGAAGIQLYYFPMGYDGRYWKSAAEANNKIAIFEDYVMKGEKLDAGFEIEPLTKLFKDKDYKQNLTWRAFKKDGKILLAICNFDFLDPAIFNLTAKGLDIGDYVAHDPIKKEYFIYSGKAETLTLPPMTIQFWIIEPHSKDIDYGKKIGTAAQKESIEALDKKYEDRMQKIKELTDVESESLPDYSKIKEIQAESFSAGKTEKDGSVFYRIANNLQSLMIELDKGACLKEWKINNVPETSMIADTSFGLFCKERFYHPKGYMENAEILKPYEFISHSLNDGELQAVFSRTIENGELAGVTITKTYIIPQNKTGFSLKYKISSPDNDGKMIGLWVFTTPSILSLTNNAKPELEIGENKYSDALKTVSIYKPEVVKISEGFEKTLKKYIGHDNAFFTIKNASAEISSPDGTLKINVDKDNLYSYLTWPFFQKTAGATFEIIYLPVRVEKDSPWETTLIFTPEIKTKKGAL
ncbi:MAG: hypothetical protein A2020_02610 [Lentisphaerae bacterium GWF2_45_14]|nr:MAG: hypothetical protein A2020_02610 [Lentisphaerae bacterium GWF2_45_14]